MRKNYSEEVVEAVYFSCSFFDGMYQKKKKSIDTLEYCISGNIVKNFNKSNIHGKLYEIIQEVNLSMGLFIRDRRKEAPNNGLLSVTMYKVLSFSDRQKYLTAAKSARNLHPK